MSEICPRHSIAHYFLKKKKKNPAVEEVICKLSRWELKSMFNILLLNSNILEFSQQVKGSF